MANNDPVLKRLGRLRILYIVWGALLLVCLILILIGNTIGHDKSSMSSSRFILNYGVIVLGFLFSLGSISLITRYYKKAQQQRTTAIQGGVPGRIATEQPISSDRMLTLPFTLKFHANWRYFVFLLILPMVLVMVIGSVVVYFFGFREIPHASAKFTTIFFAVFSGFLLLFLIILCIGYWFAARRLRQYIEVSEEGVRGRFFGQENDLH